MDTPPPNTGAIPLDWFALGFHPVGIHDLRRRLGKPSIYPDLLSRFNAADLAWFAAGVASQPANVRADEFYPELHELRNYTNHTDGTEKRKNLRKRILDLTFDCAALTDRAFGSTTLVIHVPGTMRPGSPKQPEYVKAEVYFPGHLFREDRRYSEAVSDLVQKFIQDIGIPSIIRYERCAALHWNLSKTTKIPPAYPQHGIQPAASPPSSSVFIYNGKKKSPVVVLHDDSDDNGDGSGITASQLQFLPFLENEQAFKDLIKSLRAKLQDVEQALVESRRREAELLEQLSGRSGSHSSNPLVVTHAATMPSTPRTPRTPEQARTPGYRIRTPRAPQTPGMSASVAATNSASQIGIVPASPLNQLTSTGPTSTPSPVKSSSQSAYGQFIQSCGLQHCFFSIDSIRLGQEMFLWHDALVNAGVPDALLNELMALMSSHAD